MSNKKESFEDLKDQLLTHSQHWVDGVISSREYVEQYLQGKIEKLRELSGGCDLFLDQLEAAEERIKELEEDVKFYKQAHADAVFHRDNRELL